MSAHKQTNGHGNNTFPASLWEADSNKQVMLYLVHTFRYWSRKLPPNGLVYFEFWFGSLSILLKYLCWDSHLSRISSLEFNRTQKMFFMPGTVCEKTEIFLTSFTSRVEISALES